MAIWRRRNAAGKAGDHSYSLDRKLASYLAASASVGTVLASDAKAIVISNSTVQSFGINGNVNIDFNSDGQTDFQIDHDRVDLTSHGGPVVDYLQIDKNDVNGASPGENLFATDFTVPFALNGTVANDNAQMGYLVQNTGAAAVVEYPTALLAGAEIGQTTLFDFQEGDNVYSSTKTGRFNRLIDEDHGQADVALNGKTEDQILPAFNSPEFAGVTNQVRYLGVKMDLNNANATDAANGYTYGWIGIKITNEADATGQVVGYGYETQPGVSIQAGTTGARAGDYNNDGKVDAADYVLWRNGGPLQNESATPGAVTVEDYTAWRLNFAGTNAAGAGLGSGSAVPEPGSLLMGLFTGLGLAIVYLCRRARGK